MLLRKGRKLLVKPHKAVDGKLVFAAGRAAKAAAGKLLLKLAFANQQYKAAKIAKYQKEGPQSGWYARTALPTALAHIGSTRILESRF